MPTDPSGSPGGFFDFLDPSQETSFPDEAGLHRPGSPDLDFVMGFEAGCDSSFEMVEEVRESLEPVPPVAEVKPSLPPVPSVPKRVPSMPTIFEEDEGEEEEEGDVTITPSDAQRALLPPDKFASPSVSQLSGAAVVSEDTRDDSLDTPRPSGMLLLSLSWVIADSPNDNSTAQASTFSVPAQNPFDDCFSIEPHLEDSQDFQDGSFDQLSDFFSSLIAGNESANFDFAAPFDFDTSAWNEAAFGEFHSQESTPSSSCSFLESVSKEEPSTETGVSVGTGIDADMQFLFPSVKVDAIGEWNGWPNEDEFLKAVMETVQSTPKMVSRIS